MCINEKRFGDVKCIFNLKGNYSFKSLHEKTKTPVIQFYCARDSYGKWSCHEKRRLDWHMNALMMLKFQQNNIACVFKRERHRYKVTYQNIIEYISGSKEPW